MRIAGRLGACVLAALLGAALAGCSSGGGSAGLGSSTNSVSVRNDSDMVVIARVWVGERWPSGLPGARNLQHRRTLHVSPGTDESTSLGLLTGYRSEDRSIVRVEFDPIGPSFEDRRTYWYELLPPAPYVVRITGTGGDLSFSRLSRGRMESVPAEDRISGHTAP